MKKIRFWKIKIWRCPNCRTKNVQIEEDLLACDECQGLWRADMGGLVQISEPQENGYALERMM